MSSCACNLWVEMHIMYWFHVHFAFAWQLYRWSALSNVLSLCVCILRINNRLVFVEFPLIHNLKVKFSCTSNISMIYFAGKTQTHTSYRFSWYHDFMRFGFLCDFSWTAENKYISFDMQFDTHCKRVYSFFFQISGCTFNDNFLQNATLQ